MTISSLLDELSRRLRDVERKQWDQNVLVSAVNAAFTALVNTIPSVYTVERTVDLVEGSSQQIPADLHRLVRVLHNVNPDGSPGIPVTRVDPAVMDMAAPGWRSDECRESIRHWMQVSIEERRYDVWPPACASGGATGTLPDEPVLPFNPTPEQQELYDTQLAIYNAAVAAANDPSTVPDEPVEPVEPVQGLHDVTVFGETGLSFTAPGATDTRTLSGNAMKNSGQWYWEVVVDSLSGVQQNGMGIKQMGVGEPGASGSYLGQVRQQLGLYDDGAVYEFATNIANITGFAVGDVIGWRMDLDTYTLEYNVNGGAFMPFPIGTQTSGGTFARGTWIPAISCRNGGGFTFNIAAADIVGTIPAGYQTLDMPGGLNEYDGVYDVQTSVTSPTPFNEFGWIPVADPAQPSSSFLGLYRLNNWTAPDPAWSTSAQAAVSGGPVALGDTNQRCTNGLRDASNANIPISALPVGSSYVGVYSGFGFAIESTANYVDDYQTEVVVDFAAYQAALDQYNIDLAIYNAAVAAVGAGTDDPTNTVHAVFTQVPCVVDAPTPDTSTLTAPVPPIDPGLVDPGPVSAGNVAAGGVRFAEDHDPTRTYSPSTNNRTALDIDDTMDPNTEYDIIFNVTPSLGNGVHTTTGSTANVVRVKHIPDNSVVNQFDASMGLHDRIAAGGTPYGGSPYTYLIREGDPRVEAGNSIRVIADNGRYVLGGFDVIGFNEYVPETTQQQVDDYNAALAAYQAELDQYAADLAAYNAALNAPVVVVDGVITIDSDFPLDKFYRMAILEYACYYCLIVDDDMTANSNRANNHLNAFYQLLNKQEDTLLQVDDASVEGER